MKVALVHDYLTEYGGAERVLEALHELWPDAPVYTSLFDGEELKTSAFAKASADRQISNLKKRFARSLREGITQNSKLGGDKPCNYRRTTNNLTIQQFNNWDIRPSRISTLPLDSKLTKTFTFFMPLVFENLDLREYDLVISDGTIWSKGVLTTPEQLHIFYCHTPPRWLYGYPGETDRRRLWCLQPLLKPLDNWLRIWDFESAQRPDFIIANSKEVAGRIKKFWRREAKVIYPPVNVVAGLVPAQGKATTRVATTEGGYFLVVSRLSAYKNIDLAIKVCNQLQLPLVVVGTGREEGRLKRIAGKNVKFLKNLRDSELSELYKNCKGLIHPASDEDFGIAPVEAMAHGKPAIALRSGGVQETVIDGKTGLFFNEPTTVALIKTIKQFNNSTFRSEDCIAQAAKFSKERFQEEFKEFVEERLRTREFKRMLANKRE